MALPLTQPQSVANPVRVLVVDDSAFMRKSLTTMLEEGKQIQVVGVARNGEEAVQQVQQLKPDVVTMDVEMPGMTGLQALQQIMTKNPVPVIMVSSVTVEGAQETLQALEWGAVDFIPKQLDGVASKIAEIQKILVPKVLAARYAGSKLKRLTVTGAPKLSVPVAKALSSRSVSVTRGTKLIAIGCSTGGPQALFEIIPTIPADCPAGIVIVQHMPSSFTKPFAERLNNLCALEVREAVDGDEVKPGRVLVAPGGMQFRVVKKTITTSVVKLAPNYEKHAHAPSVDIMLQSVAALFGERSIGVILTGMGHDGLDGMKAIKAVGGRTVAQDEASSVVYGMPKAVVEAGCAEKVVSLSKVIGEIMNMV
ncbi:MAG TPA: chemotaxis response regulator protein-glutamate methylesterase [Nitrospira sp.]|jgi:two-component system chemotaxis response regulator CheB|nr:chemotaxis response regulator protein-glutamate methylesterase [Nitrospira sp.]MCC7472597.1 chemotaxis response regulator protein-glutamate methylesterase [Candidatus Nomurabacteria bacterium]MBS0163584.1 chemotaxis response regulator protein-glutamate methylesterase [Nitrospira sp.]MBS0174201.1 chemotaxis response regulator protein-glutamate methylesterase [Nitrospira sp.]MBS0178396.1 chemotaxis response regulator protein-glutamate methylesterase [Nitrospira sp.]